MDLNNQQLPDWLMNADESLYPQQKKIDFFTHYNKLRLYLEENVHREVTAGANLIDPEIFLNDHGIEHIETVISRASYLVSDCECKLTPYEVYILLCCIQLHDVGNIFGRYNHEMNVVEIMREARGICGRDSVEAIIIKKIAESHGGKLSNGDKDKITTLEEETPTLNGIIRPRFIASILRFADELADDRTRASSQLLMKGKIPKKSEIFHAYAMCLDAVTIDHQESSINLRFNIPDNFINRKFGKIDEEVYLIDEIYERLTKMHFERTYCMRFTKRNIDIENIRVHITFYNSSEMKDVHDKMVFDIKENGYPSSNIDIYQMCPELMDMNGVKKDGEYFNNILMIQQ